MIFVKVFQNLSPITSNYMGRLKLFNGSERSACASAEVAIVLGIIFLSLLLLSLSLSQAIAFLPERRQLGF